jgi:hypothetical protein
MATAYNLVATKCPALPARTALLDYATGAPALFPDESAQATISKARISAISKKVEGLAALGAGAYAVVYGLALSDSGTALTAAVAAGQAVIDGPVTLGSAGTVLLADNAYNWLYLLQNGTLTKTSAGTDTPPAAPSSTCVYLGRIQVTAGVQSSPDGSGVLYFRGGSLYRRTGDVDMPADTPPNYIIDTETQSGVFRWTGTQYLRPPQTGRYAETFASADKTLPAAQYNKGFLQAQGTNAGAQNWILPLIDGLGFDVTNATGQTVTFKGATGAGVAVATGKAARIRTDGTNYIRVTADVTF